MKNNSHDTMINFSEKEIQKLSKKYFGDELTKKELGYLATICSPQDWSRVDDGGYEGCLGLLIQAITAIIGLTRQDRRRRR